MLLDKTILTGDEPGQEQRSSRLQVIDLTQTLVNGMPFYPGTAPPGFSRRSTIESQGYLERELRMLSHTGTHVDAPAHVLTDGLTLSQISASHFLGPGCKLDLTDLKRPVVGLDEIVSAKDILVNKEFLLLHTGWDKYWGREEYFADYPVLTPEAAAWLSGLGLKGLGVDAVSVDASTSQTYPIHKTLLGHGLVIIENLTNLQALPLTGFIFSGLPLKIKDGDGAPVRAVAFIG